MHYASRDTVTAFRNNYTHPANYTSLLNPNGLEVSVTAFQCRFNVAACYERAVHSGGHAACRFTVAVAAGQAA